MANIRVVTNSIPRDIIYGFELTETERACFDYYTAEEIDDAMFFRYRGQTYDIGEFMRTPAELAPWDGYASDSYSSGVVIRYPRMDYNPREIDTDHIIVGWYY